MRMDWIYCALMFNLIEPNMKSYHMSQVGECKINYDPHNVIHITYLITIRYIYWVYYVRISYPIRHKSLIQLVKKEKLFSNTTTLMSW